MYTKTQSYKAQTMEKKNPTPINLQSTKQTTVKRQMEKTKQKRARMDENGA